MVQVSGHYFIGSAMVFTGTGVVFCFGEVLLGVINKSVKFK